MKFKEFCEYMGLLTLMFTLVTGFIGLMGLMFG